MSASRVVDTLIEHTREFQEVLGALCVQSEQQERVLTSGTDQEIAEYVRRKTECVAAFLRVTAQIEECMRTAVFSAKEKTEIESLLTRAELQAEPLIQSLLDRETRDQQLVERTQAELNSQLSEIRQARATLEELRTHYTGNADREQTIFNQEG